MNELQFRSIPLNILIENYKPTQFECAGCTYSDEYTPPSGNQKYGSYVLIMSTGEITDQRQLNSISVQFRQHAEFVMMLFKYITGSNLFFDQVGIDLSTKRILLPGDCPQGWTSNFNELSESLNSSYRQGAIKLFTNPQVQIRITPLLELQLMLVQYGRMNKTIRYLMHLNYEASIASPMVRRMAYGKVLEIIDAIHPLGKRKKDTRIEEFYGGMQEYYKGITIKYLMELANTRGDTRHYVAAKGDVKAHAFLTYEELVIYEPLIDNLAINEVRQRFDFPLILLEKKNKQTK